MQDPRPLPRHITAGLRERCPVRHIGPPLAPPRDATALGGQSRPTDQTGRPAKYDGPIGTTALAARKTSHRVQDTRYCVRALRDRIPTYIASLITPYVPRRALRSADRALLVVPRHNLERYGRRSFSRTGPTLWNALPEDLRSTECMNKFKAHLKTFYFKIACNRLDPTTAADGRSAQSYNGRHRPDTGPCIQTIPGD